jgi:hypothetical protein
MGTTPLNKNGHDQSQDRDIRELKEHFRAVRVANEKDHGRIKEVLSDLTPNSSYRCLDVAYCSAWWHRVGGEPSSGRTQ